jgi:hypothetical protein
MLGPTRCAWRVGSGVAAVSARREPYNVGVPVVLPAGELPGIRHDW